MRDELTLGEAFFLAALRGSNGAWRAPRHSAYRAALARAATLDPPAAHPASEAGVARALQDRRVVEPMPEPFLLFWVRTEYALLRPDLRQQVLLAARAAARGERHGLRERRLAELLDEARLLEPSWRIRSPPGLTSSPSAED